jgi:hypothetical protein
LLHERVGDPQAIVHDPVRIPAAAVDQASAAARQLEEEGVQAGQDDLRADGGIEDRPLGRRDRVAPEVFEDLGAPASHRPLHWGEGVVGDAQVRDALDQVRGGLGDDEVARGEVLPAPDTLRP